MKIKFAKFLLPILGSTIFLSCGCSNNVIPEPEPQIEAIDFCECDWDDIVDACNRLENGIWTEDQFCQRFKFGQTQATQLSDFVGKTRKINVNSLSHEVVVLGCQHDYMDVYWTKPAIFTFQFNNLISSSSGNAISIKWDYREENGNYWDSTLLYFLENLQSPSVDSVYEMILADNEWIRYGFKEIYFGVNKKVTDTTDHWALSFKKTHLFCPTIADIFSKKGIKGTDESFIRQQDKTFYINEGKQYEYYQLQNNIGSKKIYYGDYVKHPCLLRKDLNNQYHSYWLTSPCVENETKAWYAYYDNVNESSYLDWNKSTMGSLPVAPCFCI